MKRVALGIVAMALLVAMALPAMAYEAFKGPLGILQKNEGTYDGYTLIVPQNSKVTYLIDLDGNVVNTWKSEYIGFYAQLLPNGNLLRNSETPGVLEPNFGGATGIVEEFDWDGKKVWEYRCYEPEKYVNHHLVHRMPNGNTLLIVWEYKTFEEAVAKGRDLKNPDNALKPEGFTKPNGTVIKGIWPDAVWEINPAGEKVWSWSMWDHIGTGPKQFDINYVLPKAMKRDNYSGTDWSHCNGISYDPVNDKILLNSRNFGEFFVIDHKTGTMDYRWGNPSTHGEGAKPAGYFDNGSQILFGPHGAEFLENGNISVLDNGTSRPFANYSRAVEMDPKTGKIVWEFGAGNIGAELTSFSSPYQSGAQKLPNGNWLITSTHGGHMIEVTADKNIVWEAVNPVNNDVIFKTTNSQGIHRGLMIHKALRYGKDYGAFKGRDIKPTGMKFPNWVELLSQDPNPAKVNKIEFYGE